MSNQPPKPIRAETVITGHENADFDALAAMIGASSIYPDSVLVFPGSHEASLRDFYIQSTTYLFNFKNFKEIDIDSVRRVVVVDTRQKGRVSHIAPLLDRPDIEYVTYDHHPDSADDIDADIQVWKPWGSTATIITHELMRLGIELGPEEATVIGLGIFEDTGSFSFNSTVPEDFAAAGWLRSHGMDLQVIADLLSRDLTTEQVQLLGEMVENATSHDFNGVEVVITQVSREGFVNEFAYLVHKFIDMESVGVLFVLGRMGDRIHLVARSRSPEVNVGEVCKHFGGGGHSYAASATIKDKPLAEARDELFNLLLSRTSPQLCADKLMSRPPVFIAEDKTMDDAVELMGRFSLKGVPVVAAEGRKCVGLLEHKIADKAVAHDLGTMPIGEYMGRDFQVVRPDTDLYEVMEIVLGKRQRLLPVSDDEGIIGVITRTDLVNVLVEEPARIPESLAPESRRERSIKSLMRNRLPSRLLGLLDEAGKLGRELGLAVYAVGGFVRDIMLNRPNFDLDLVVEGDGMEFARALAEKLGGRVKTHQKFKTGVVILPDGQRVDVATARLEYYEYPAALPTVELSSIKMDLYRRDFTMNALAVDLNPDSFGQVVDFFGAQRDIKERVIRVLHSLSFVEDPTRILRAVRFEQRFKFRIGGQTLRLIKNAVGLNLFNRLSGARIFHELQLIMDEEEPLSCLTRMHELKLLKAIHPLLGLDHDQSQLIMELEKVHSWFNLLYLDGELKAWKLYFLALLMDLESEEAGQVLQRLGLTGREQTDFLTLRGQVGASLGKLMYWSSNPGGKLSEFAAIIERLPLEGVLFLMARSRKESTRKQFSHYLTWVRHLQPDVDGVDLKAMDIEPGPAFSKILGAVRSALIDGEAETREAQLEVARRIAEDLRRKSTPEVASESRSGRKRSRKS